LIYNHNACAIEQRVAVAARLQAVAVAARLQAVAVAARLEAVSNQMKVYVEVELHFHTFLTSASDAGEWPASRLGRHTSVEKSTVSIRWGVWVCGPQSRF
jgi:hypothetical protein